MNLSSKGARRTLAVACSTAVVAAGASFFVAPAYAAKAKATGLTLSGSTSVTSLNLAFKTAGANIDQDATKGVPAVPAADTLAANLEAATYAYHVTNSLSSTASKLALVLDSYSAPTGVTVPTVASGSADVAVTDAALVYGEADAGATAVPNDTWKAVSTNNTSTYYFLEDPTALAQTTNTYITATQPGTYKFHFVDTAASLTGTDDDVVSPTVTMTVLDAFGATGSGSDDWSPTVSVSSSALKLGAPVTASVPLSALTTVDARGSSNGVGMLAQQIKPLVGFQFSASTAMANLDLGGVTLPAAGGAALNATTVAVDGLPTTAGSVAANAVQNWTFASGTNSGTVASNLASDGAGAMSLTVPALGAAIVDNADVHILSGSPYHMVGVAAAADYSTAHNDVTSSAVSVTIPSNRITHAGVVTVTAALDKVGDGGFDQAADVTALSGAPTAEYASNKVSAWKWGPVEVTGSVAAATTSTVKAKTGLSTVSYKATVTAVETGGSVAGQTVYFTVQPGSANDSVSANGTLVSSTASTGQKVYSVTSDSAGVATIAVTSSAATVGKTYTIKANVNGVAATSLVAGETLVSDSNTTVTYEGSQPTTLVDTTPGQGRYPVVGTASVTLTGSIIDQFGAVAQPDASYSQNVKMTIAGADTYVTPVAGKFSYTYTPSTAPLAGATTATKYTYEDATAGIGPFSDSAGAGGLIHWVPNTSAGTVTLTGPADGASSGQTLSAGSGTPTGVAVSGSVVDSGNSAIPFKLVSLSGSEGVLFSTSATGATGLSSTLQVGADASGVFNAYVFYTKAGSATVTAASDGKSDTSTVETTTATDPYKVIVKDALVRPGGTVTISGEVKDAFGNPVENEYVSLSIGSTGLGVLSSSNPKTNSGGVFTSTFSTADATREGEATITAKLRDTLNTENATVMTTNPLPATAWATAGVTVAHGEYTDQATLTVAKAQPTTISAPSSRVGAGRITLTGKAVPGVVVEIYSRPAGSSAAFGWIDSVMSDESNGSWTATEWISASTTYIAKTSTSTSSATTVAVVSKVASVTMTARPLGRGLVKIAVNGSPNVKGTITLYQGSKRVKSWPSNAWGDGGLTVKTTRGKKTFRVVFAPAGYTAGSRTVTVTVR